MQLNIKIKQINSSTFEKESNFFQFPIKIGREQNNDIVLDDPDKLVSRKHARIEISNGEFQIVDLMSRNSTFINELKLEPESEQKLEIGDLLRIGGFTLEITGLDIGAENDDDSFKTKIFKSPFEEEVLMISRGVEKLSEKYELTEDNLRDEYLKLDLRNNLNQINFNNIIPFLGEYFPHNLSGENNIAKSSFAKKNLTGENANSKSESIKNYDNKKQTIENYSFGTQFTDSYDLLLESITKLIQGYWQFRQEFFGVTIFESMPTASAEKLKEFLFDDSVSDIDCCKRIELFKEELNKILSHQIGLLDGYKDSINEGIENVLNEVDPEVLEQKIKNEKIKLGSVEIPIRYIPFYAKIKSILMVKKIHEKILLDINVVERKHFRPAFMKGYQKRIHLGNGKK